MHDPLVTIIQFLLAAVIAVPVFQRPKLGAILGYLVAGAIIGPYVLNFVHDPESTLHFAEIGVVLLLFIIGLELSPEKLWRMRDLILMLGTAQLVGTIVIIFGVVLIFFPVGPVLAVIIGLALALSSTAFAIQLMADYRILNTPLGNKRLRHAAHAGPGGHPDSAGRGGRRAGHRRVVTRVVGRGRHNRTACAARTVRLPQKRAGCTGIGLTGSRSLVHLVPDGLARAGTPAITLMSEGGASSGRLWFTSLETVPDTATLARETAFFVAVTKHRLHPSAAVRGVRDPHAAPYESPVPGLGPGRNPGPRSGSDGHDVVESFGTFAEDIPFAAFHRAITSHFEVSALKDFTLEIPGMVMHDRLVTRNDVMQVQVPARASRREAPPFEVADQFHVGQAPGETIGDPHFDGTAHSEVQHAELLVIY